MKYALCPPCGTVFSGETEEDVVRATQEHAQKKHDYLPPRAEILSVMTSTRPAPGISDVSEK